MNINGKILKPLVARVAPVVSTDTTRTSGIVMLHVFAAENGALALFGTDGHRIHRATRGDVRELLAGMHVWYRDGVLPQGWGHFPISQRDLASFKSAIDTHHRLEMETQTFTQTGGRVERDAPAPCAVVLVQHHGMIGGPSVRQFLYSADCRVNLHQVIPVRHEKRASIPFSRLEGWVNAGPSPAKGAPLHQNAIQAVRIYGAPYDPTTGLTGWAFGIEGGEGAGFLAAVHRPYLAEAAKACKRRGSFEVSVQISGDLDPVVLAVGDPRDEPTSDETETFTAVIMPIRV